MWTFYGPDVPYEPESGPGGPQIDPILQNSFKELALGAHFGAFSAPNLRAKMIPKTTLEHQ